MKKRRNIKNTILYLFGILFLGISVFFFASFFLSQPETIEELEYDLDEATTMVKMTDQIEYDVNEMRSKNSDFAGWIMIPDTNISLPVVQGKDNDFYLTHGFTKAYSSYGCPFLEYDAAPTDTNKVIHGHNMGSNSDKIFSTLVEYQEEEYAKAHKYIYFSEPGIEGQMYEVFAVVNYNIAAGHKVDYRTKNFENDKDYAEFVSFMKKHGVYASDTFTPADTPLLILSTCNRRYGEDNRLLICAGKIENPMIELEIETGAKLFEKISELKKTIVTP